MDSKMRYEDQENITFSYGVIFGHEVEKCGKRTINMANAKLLLTI